MSNTTQASSNHLQPSDSLLFFINSNKLQSTVIRKFDTMGATVGFTDFTILYYLYTAVGNKLRRIDLADKIGLTASGVTRLLPPLEKIGLIARDSDPRDARVSYVTLTPSGVRVLEETLERAEHTAQSIMPNLDDEYLRKLILLQDDIRRAAL